MQYFTSFFRKFKPSLLMKRVFVVLNNAFAMLYIEPDTKESSYCEHLCNRKFASALSEHHEILNSAFGEKC